jgi:hypothetical protein
MDIELDGSPKSKSNSLSIRLTESAVFLTTDGHTPARGSEQRSTLLRGLLILQLVKPTKIKSIDVELTATASSSWPEGDTLSNLLLFLYLLIILNLGIGARRIEVIEEHRVFHASNLFFRAGKSHRRTASIGPGISYNNTDIDDDLDLLSYSNGTPIRNTSSTASTSNTNNEVNSLPQTSTPTPSRSRSRSFFPRIPYNRRMSIDASQFRNMSLDNPDDAPRHLNTSQLPPIPPYSPFTPPVMASDASDFRTAHGVNNTNLIHSVSDDRPPASSVPSLENSRHSPYATFRGSYIYLFSFPTLIVKIYFISGRAISPSRSRHEDMIPEDDTVDAEHPILPTNPSSLTLTSPPSSPTSIPVDSHSPTTPRGRKRFSFSSVSNVFIDAVRASSPRSRTGRFAQSRERGSENGRERSIDTPIRGDRRGRTMERGGGDHVIVNEDIEKDTKHVKEKGRGIIAMMLG